MLGDFVFTMLEQDERPNGKTPGDEHQMWAQCLVDQNASPGLFNAFNIAWKVHQAAKG